MSVVFVFMLTRKNSTVQNITYFFHLSIYNVFIGTRFSMYLTTFCNRSYKITEFPMNVR